MVMVIGAKGNYPDETPEKVLSPDPAPRKGEGKMDKDELQRVIQGLVKSAIDYVDGELSPDRAKATDLYMGRKFGNEEKGRSQVVSTDVRDGIRALLPHMLRALVGAEKAVEFRARYAGKVAEAEQATDYVNYVFMEDNEGFLLTHTVLKDGLLKKIGAFKWYWDDTSEVENFSPRGVTEDQLATLMADPEVEVTAIEDAGATPDGVPLFDVEFTVSRQDGRARVVAIPPEELIHNREARSLDEATFFAHVTEKSQGELIAMGIDKKIVEKHGKGSSRTRRSNEEAIARNPSGFQGFGSDEEAGRANEKAQYVEAYVKLDVDGDGIAELRKICTIGEDNYIVENVPVRSRPFALFTPDPEPHTVVGLSWADLLGDVQKIKSMVQRSMLDSLAQSIHPRTWYKENDANLADVLNTAIGAPIRTKSGPTAVGEFAHNFVGKEGFAVLEYFDDVIERRTGQNKGAAGLDADALQSSTKAAVAAAVTSSQAQQELLVRIFAETTLKRMFRGLLELLIENQPRSRMVRLRNQYVEVDPRQWDAEMEVTVNVTLGTGLMEEKIATLVGIIEKQELILQTLGQDNPIVTLKQYRDTLAEVAELRGRKDSEKYFTPITDEQLQQMQEAAAQQQPPPSPEMVLAQAQIQIEQMKAERQIQIEQMKMERQLEQERRKMEFDLEIKRREMELRERELILKDDRERDKAAADIALKRLEINATNQLVISQQQLDNEIEQARLAIMDSPAEEGAPRSRRKRVTFERDAEGRAIGATVEELEDEL